MKTKRFLLMAGIVLATAFTFSCGEKQECFGDCNSELKKCLKKARYSYDSIDCNQAQRKCSNECDENY